MLTEDLSMFLNQSIVINKLGNHSIKKYYKYYKP